MPNGTTGPAPKAILRKDLRQDALKVLTLSQPYPVGIMSACRITRYARSDYHRLT